jgi:hypothetical protein
MHDSGFPVALVNGVPVVTAPEEIDITNAPELGSALLEAAETGPGTLVADMTRTRFATRPGSIPCWRHISAPKPKAVSCCWPFPAVRSSASSRSPPSTV